MGRSIVANVPGRFLAGDAFIDRQDASPVAFDPTGGCDRGNRFARAADDGSSQFERCRLYLAARCGSCTDASFGAVFRYPLIRLSRPGRTTLSSLLREAPSSSFPRECAHPAALLGFCPSQFCSRGRVVAPHKCGG